MTEATTIALRQSTCVSIGGRGVLIEGPPGCGKSSLGLALIDRGAMLVGDDGVALKVRDHRLWAAPAPATNGLLEIRNIGLVEMPVVQAPVCLLLRLDALAPRYVGEADAAQVEGITVPALALWPDTPVLALRAEAALAKFGLALA